MAFRSSAFSFTRNSDPGGGDSLLSDMFQPSIPESLPSYPSGTGRRFFLGGGASVANGNKIQHLPPPPSPVTKTIGLHSSGAAGGYGYSSSRNHEMDIPSSPPSHLYSTPPTSKKPFRSFRTGGNMSRAEDLSASPPPLSTFYDEPIDGSLRLTQEEAEEEEEDRYASISSYRRDAGFVSSGTNCLDKSGTFGVGVGGSRKRTWSATLDDDEYYENGRGPLVRAGSDGTGAQDGRGTNGGGKRRIIDVVGSVASKLWEVVKGNAAWGFYYPGSILSASLSKQQQQQVPLQQQPRDDTGENTNGYGRASGEYIEEVTNNGDGLDISTTDALQSGRYYTNDTGFGTFTSAVSGRLERRESMIEEDGDFSSLHESSSMPAPESPTRPQRTSSTAFSRRNSISQPLDADSGLRASWVLVPQQEFVPTAAQRPSSSRSHLGRAAGRPTGHVRSASAATTNMGGKKRPYRFPVKPVTTGGNVMFDFGTGSPRRSRKKSLSGGGWGAWPASSPGHGSEEEDEVDESMRRWNEKLKAMIREGKEALGSKVEVVYED
ncbi:hypothetical protein BDZ91DRAFT_763982 [Kalaharituber pfeilii]|nr:hypothetical protein BDZ91DRAFT_763982 [Kalaharituber pfeilii]